MNLRRALTIFIISFIFSFFKHFYCTSHFQKRNIIIFFTKPDIDAKISPIDDSGIQFLKFPVSGMVQSSDEVPQEFENIFKINLNSPDCNAILNTYLLDLINWAIEDNRMVTATVSNEESDFNRILLKNMGSNLEGSYKNYKYTLHLPQSLKTQRMANFSNPEPLDPYRNNAMYPNKFDNLPLATIDPLLRDSPPLRYENHGDFMRDITAYNLNDEDSDEFGFKRVREKIQASNRIIDDKITRKMYTTIASTINKKKHTVSDGKTTSVASTETNTNKPFYNFLALSSFFNKLQDVFVNSLLNPYEKRDMNSDENEIDLSVLGKVHENTLLKLVRSSLKSLQMQSRDHGPKIHGFLLIVIGGNLTEISDPFSELIQSIKYAVEHTNKKDTLILVTCYCPIRTLENKVEKRQIPFFAGGMGSNEFENSVGMWDILDKMKSSVKKTWKKGKAKANHIINPHKNEEKCNKNAKDTNNQSTELTTSATNTSEFGLLEDM